MIEFGWLVDGMNVIGSRPSGWWKDLDGAIAAFVEELRAYAGRTGEAITVVFDHQAPGVSGGPGDVRVVFATRSRRDSADDEIVRILEGSPPPRPYRVVTSDRDLAERAIALGAEVVSAGSFRHRLDAGLGGPEQAGPS